MFHLWQPSWASPRLPSELVPNKGVSSLPAHRCAKHMGQESMLIPYIIHAKLSTSSLFSVHALACSQSKAALSCAGEAEAHAQHPISTRMPKQQNEQCASLQLKSCPCLRISLFCVLSTDQIPLSRRSPSLPAPQLPSTSRSRFVVDFCSSYPQCVCVCVCAFRIKGMLP